MSEKEIKYEREITLYIHKYIYLCLSALKILLLHYLTLFIFEIKKYLLKIFKGEVEEQRNQISKEEKMRQKNKHGEQEMKRVSQYIGNSSMHLTLPIKYTVSQRELLSHLKTLTKLTVLK